MKILPAQLYNINSNAEVKVFEFLQKSSFGDDAIAFHSLNIPHHINQRFGEADFVLLSEYGLIVLEVKGGSVTRTENNWSFTDRNGNTNTSYKGPFRQVEDNLHSIFNNLKIEFNFISDIVIGYGVITPDCDLPKSLELDNMTLFGYENFNQNLFNNWLINLKDYWTEKNKNSKTLTQEEITKVAQYLRPQFEIPIPLHSQLIEIDEQAYKFTNDQFKFLDIIEINKRVLCSGGAGTGKTFMAVELCRRFSSKNKILFICKSKILQKYLQHLLQLTNVLVSTIDSIEISSKRHTVDKFDILIVDEGQDICNATDINKLRNYLNGGWKNGQWIFFHDVNNQANIIGEYSKKVMDALKSYLPAEIPLKKNCRNTKPIMNKIQTLTSFDMGNVGTGIGPEVDFIYYSEKPEEKLIQVLINLHKNNIDYNNITILSTKDFQNSCINNLHRDTKKKIEIIDERNISKPNINKIKFCTISNYKGLESQSVILIDMDKNIENYNSLLYVGMSRARSKLTIIIKQGDL